MPLPRFPATGFPGHTQESRPPRGPPPNQYRSKFERFFPCCEGRRRTRGLSPFRFVLVPPPLFCARPLGNPRNSPLQGGKRERLSFCGPSPSRPPLRVPSISLRRESQARKTEKGKEVRRRRMGKEERGFLLRRPRPRARLRTEGLKCFGESLWSERLRRKTSDECGRSTRKGALSLQTI